MIVITTVGSSLVENLHRFLNDKEFEKKFANIEKCKKDKFTKIRKLLEHFRKDKNLKEKYKSQKVDEYKNKYKQTLLDFCKNCFPLASAELTSLYKLKEKIDKENKENEKLDIYLIVSDTNEGYFVGEILKEALESEGIKEELKINKVELKHIKDLRIDSTDNFRSGLNNLIDTIYEIIVRDEKNQTVYGSDEVIFNITGGYKGVIPYISTIAQIFGYEIVYTFESIEKENDLISVEPLLLSFDEDFTDLYLPFLFEEGLEILDKVSKQEKKLENLKIAKNVDYSKIRETEKYLELKKHLVELKNNLLEYGLVSDKNKKLQLTSLGNLIKLKSQNKKGKLGYILELLITKKLTQENPNSKVEPSKIYETNNKSGELDIFIEKNNQVEAVEIKSLSKFYKSKEQIKRHAEYLECLKKSYKLTIILYVLDREILKTNKFKNFVSSLRNISNNIKIQYLEYTPDKLDRLIKKFDNLEIHNYEED
ncbi:putative CRISPR-associated protein [Persephonella sp. KM09-Lau-8]|uniref:putative CRISPR-associated protein n=1 Tax=Persephonella sp. KM09-Lau-8 TaxID=1158345 RepID=UPI00049558DF|nr:putative CRISPR-associated protein [Persephonella sp. KM09-Lau-8]